MTEERVRELARKHEEAHSWDTTTREQMLVQFAHEIIAETREECARVCDDLSFPIDHDQWMAMTKKEHGAYACRQCAAAIRAKG